MLEETLDRLVAPNTRSGDVPSTFASLRFEPFETQLHVKQCDANVISLISIFVFNLDIKVRQQFTSFAHIFDIIIGNISPLLRASHVS